MILRFVELGLEPLSKAHGFYLLGKRGVAPNEGFFVSYQVIDFPLVCKLFIILAFKIFQLQNAFFQF